MNIHIFGREIIDDKTVVQFENCMQEEGSIGVLTADAHYGYSMPVGGSIAYKGQISPTGVGFDIGCGNHAVKMEVKAKDINVETTMNEIMNKISFGVGRKSKYHMYGGMNILNDIEKANFEPQRALHKLANEQLGTVGSGNHFIDLFEDEEGWLWVGLHFGSRGFGHKTASGFLAMAQGKKFEDKPDNAPMDSKPVLFDVTTTIGQAYIEAMQLAGEYAKAGRIAVMACVRDIIGYPEVLEEVHNHHNFAWQEYHNDELYWVVRKGCTPAFPGQKGFIGANMKDCSYVIEGVDTPLSAKGLYSTVHGAGRVMSRTQAAGKMKWVKDNHGKKVPKRITKGVVDWKKVQETLNHKNIILRGGGADEAPMAYKKLHDVLQHQGETIKIVHTLRPIGVAMAGEGEYDPYVD